MIKPLLYYSKDGTRIEFNKYTIDDCGIIKNGKGEVLAYTKNKEGYNRCSVYDDSKKQRHIFVCRAVVSTFIGPPPTPAHTYAQSLTDVMHVTLFDECSRADDHRLL